MNFSQKPILSSPSSYRSGEGSLAEAISHDIYLLDLADEAQAVAREAARLAFPSGHTRTVSNLTEIEPQDGARCLVVLGRPEAAATLIGDNGGSPRCAVVVLGHDRSDVAETVPPEEWNSPLLARVFRSALLEQELVRENIRLRGDLKTVARRVSHDLRTPVGCIYTTSDVFKELPAGDVESVTSMAAIIKESAGEISQIVDRVSFVLKASADPVTPTRVDMGGVVATVLAQLDAELQKAGAQISLPSSWPETSGVAPWLLVVWSNLLRNAFQHGGPAAKIQIAWKADNGGYVFSVIDHGNGVAPARINGLFSPFDRLYALHVPGLGLCFVQRLVSLQGGRCGYEKAPGAGAHFYFTLPAAR
jgi:signal transduction histidine kinase